MKIYCPQVDSVVECDCSDKCDAYKVDLKLRIAKVFSKELNKKAIGSDVLIDIQNQISEIIDN